MKKHFITGLVILLPLAITIAVVGMIMNFLTQPFVGMASDLFEKFSFYAKYKSVLRFVLQIVLLFGLFFTTVLLGFLARLMIFKSLLSVYDKILHRIPIIKTVYKAAQQVMTTIFGSKSGSFKQVVMVPFPNKGVLCIGLVAGDAPTTCSQDVNDPMITVFIPTTPNPTSGFLTLFKKSDITFLDMKIEDAFKYVISCGVLNSDPCASSPFINPKS
ncbi:DUF502 domain-containing protein [Chlamydia trachomatis]|jgi:Uncharacterized conserved protein|uniref:Membrane protein n=2 Tax=Chlamydia muridarum TaxID=83560 RepID=A0A070A7N4_CHLMR|nr:DUF502 domain-containing protein [Chlamydia muridarum]UFT35854.1 DUF502 domain-containing protein [Chlamydia trachomatis]AAF39516.1 conserved hypothetical protein [Chlamydia muridarum str. Nigg]AHH23087.1 membrane protein [Chlamydia muridarum str. Nigg3 CMUT3-5]AHH24012.1 membrane protein [Chlamydia muridarum str. Nigg CM972]AID38219.1 membrane protein [Chlamydia muridarum str. Nigg 2 MCR]